MAVYNSLNAQKALFCTWRQHLHQNPELGLQEYKTTAFIQNRLDEMGIPYHTGYAHTGVVAVLKNGTSPHSIGLRADIDALPITEQSTIPYASKNTGVMHACGHDGHTAILLATAKYLSETKNFYGTVYLYFQPAEEGKGGARLMLQDGVFDRFKPDAMYALHNHPKCPTGYVGYRTGALSANSDRFQIYVKGTGSHAADPHKSTDPLVICSHLVLAIQTIVSRNTNPMAPAVVSACMMQVGSADNIIAETGEICGTVRTVDTDTQNIIERRLGDICAGIGDMFNCDITLNYVRGYPMVVNTDVETESVRLAAIDVVGQDKVFYADQVMAGEDFAFFLQQVSGAYFLVGNGTESHDVHTPQYDFNDDIIPIGASIFVRLVERELAK